MDKVLYPEKGNSEPATVCIYGTGALAAGTAGYSSQQMKYGTYARTGVGTGTITFAAPGALMGSPVCPRLFLIKATAEDMEIEVVSVVLPVAGATSLVINYRIVSNAAPTTPKDPVNACIVNLLMIGKDSKAI